MTRMECAHCINRSYIIKKVYSANKKMVIPLTKQSSYNSHGKQTFKIIKEVGYIARSIYSCSVRSQMFVKRRQRS